MEERALNGAVGPAITENIFNSSVRELLIQTQAEGVVACLYSPV